MSQELQDEEESQEGALDQGLQEVCWQGDGHCKLSSFFFLSLWKELMGVCV